MTQRKDFKIIGILGGMGPMATVECFKTIIEKTPAEKDQNHIPIFINNIPQVPDRTDSIIGDGENPVPILRSSAKKLEGAGADFLIIPCNTAHYYIEEIQSAVKIPILNMIKSTIESLPKDSNVGLLATSGTISTGIYQKYAKGKVNIITPDKDFQDLFMKIIYGKKGVKAGYDGEILTKKMLEIVKHLREKGADNFIAGCTEVRIILDDLDIDKGSLFKPIDVIAEKSVQIALGNKEI
ncbi:MAG: aspartate/glutamate racemase family protein [Thermoplasmatota archaeon]